MNVHKRCQKNVANNCGINTKMMAEILNEMGISPDKNPRSKTHKFRNPEPEGGPIDSLSSESESKELTEKSDDRGNSRWELDLGCRVGGQFPKPVSFRACLETRAVWTDALSCKNSTPRDNFPRRFCTTASRA
ncbi:Protein kinase C [Eumeta japonica]|uniref:Protein kinase C n=1 Tax=Eumeta variegata TaxID=151549 RepID=A0A4C2A3L0_EUMVA|nr:Protein kinase C [Eumeta japonica]